MTVPFQLPSAAEEAHRAISRKAAVLLGGMIDGNGFKAAQARLVREETQIHAIPAAITVELRPDIAKTQLRGRNPQGEELGSEAEVTPHAARLARESLADGSAQQEILQALKKAPGEGFGMAALEFPVGASRKEFCTVSSCQKCSGAGSVSCAACQSTGKTPCQTCRGEGFSPCRTCFGVGMVQDAGGNRMPCMRCQNSGRIVCVTCNGLRQLSCPVCAGRGSMPCDACGQSGSTTVVYKVVYKALCQFDIDWRAVPPEVHKIAEKLGIVQLVVKAHAEVYWQPPEIRDDKLLIAGTAFLPVANAEFSVGGKAYPATVAGLQGRIVAIDPLLDAAVKPGISALMKLSKGPLAAQALIDTACRYRLVRQALAGLVRHPKKTVYQALAREYPAVLSDKYARAAVLYAAKAVLSISAGPRYKGLAAGTALAALLAAAYYMTPLRQAVLARMGEKVALADIFIWLIGSILAFFTIKFMTAAAFRKMLPSTVRLDKGGLPSAGPQGIAAFFTAGLACIVIAACAVAKPAWIMHIMR